MFSQNIIYNLQFAWYAQSCDSSLVLAVLTSSNPSRTAVEEKSDRQSMEADECAIASTIMDNLYDIPKVLSEIQGETNTSAGSLVVK